MWQWFGNSSFVIGICCLTTNQHLTSYLFIFPPSLNCHEFIPFCPCFFFLHRLFSDISRLEAKVERLEGQLQAKDREIATITRTVRNLWPFYRYFRAYHHIKKLPRCICYANIETFFFLKFALFILAFLFDSYENLYCLGS